MKLGEVETYKMSDIKFKLENIMTDKMTVYIQYKEETWYKCAKEW